MSIDAFDRATSSSTLSTSGAVAVARGAAPVGWRGARFREGSALREARGAREAERRAGRPARGEGARAQGISDQTERRLIPKYGFITFLYASIYNI